MLLEIKEQFAIPYINYPKPNLSTIYIHYNVRNPKLDFPLCDVSPSNIIFVWFAIS